MKQLRLFIFAFSLLSTSYLYSYDFKVGGIYYNYDAASQSAIVTYDGEGTNGDKSDPERYTGKVVIPSTVTYNGRTINVTKLSRDAFYNCKSLTEVVLPNTIIEIGNDCFYDCTSLNKADLPDNIETIREGAFTNTKIKTVKFPKTLKSLGFYSYYGCSELNSVYIDCSPNITSGSNREGVFFKSDNIKEVIFGEEVSQILTNRYWDFGEKISTITVKNPEPPRKKNYDGSQLFGNNIYLNTKLIVPKNCKQKYSEAEEWKNFFVIEEKDFGGSSNRCEKPQIYYSNGMLSYTCATAGASFVSTITDTDVNTHNGSSLRLSATYNISVYATKDGYDNSETATATLCWIDVAPKTEGITNSVATVRAMSIMIQNSDGQLTISGVDDGTPINVYNINGIQEGSSISRNGSAMVNTNLTIGSVAIVKIGDKSIKVVLK